MLFEWNGRKFKSTGTQNLKLYQDFNYYLLKVEASSSGYMPERMSFLTLECRSPEGSARKMNMFLQNI